jgi:dTDP-4-dehydrorhamnose reductase
MITGASGLLGAHLVLAARDRHEVVGIYFNHELNRQMVASRQVDLRQPDAVTNCVGSVRPDWIIHCAAQTSVDQCQSNPGDAYRTNVLATENVLRAAVRWDARVLYISTDSVFDGARGWYREDDLPSPVNTYASTKFAGEQAVLRYSASALVVRTNFYGWGLGTESSLAEWLVGRLEQGEVVGGFTDVFFTPLLVNDLAEVLLAAIDRDATGLLHVASRQRCSKFAFARSLATIFGYDPDLVYPRLVAEAGLKAPRPRDTSLDTSRLATQFGSQPPDVESGLRRMQALGDAGHSSTIRALRAA